MAIKIDSLTRVGRMIFDIGMDVYTRFMAGKMSPEQMRATMSAPLALELAKHKADIQAERE